MPKKISDAVMIPGFVEKLAHAHYARLARCVVLTGNIYDLFPLSEGGKTRFVGLDELMEKVLHSAKYLCEPADEQFIVVKVKSDGIHLASYGENANASVQRMIESKSKNASSPGNIQVVSNLIQDIARARNIVSAVQNQYVRPLCVIIDHAETIFPNVEAGRMNTQQVEAWKWFSDLIRREDLWASAETADQRPDLIILLSPTISEINPKIFTLPKVELVEIPLPNSSHGILPPEFEEDARGLTLRAMDDLVTASKRDPINSPLTRETVVAEVTKRLVLELRGTVKLVRPEHTMADLVGWSKLKPRLSHLARRIDNSRRAPVGMVVTGPNGAGKTFGIEAWAAEMGRTVLTLAGGMKSKWYGETGIFLETFERMLSVYGRTCVVVDEAHKAFGSIQDPDTYQADAEYARHIIQMMSNPKYRSKVFWVLITTRPDLLDPDFKRSGRCSLFVPVCDPEGEDFDAFFDWMIEILVKEGITLTEDTKVCLREKAKKEKYAFSAGDFRRFIDELVGELDYWQNEVKSSFDMPEFIRAWKPSAARIGPERRLHTLLAVKDADWRELVPASFRDMNERQIEMEISKLKLLIDMSN